MAQQPVLLQLPDDLYERVRRVAEENNRPLEEVLIDSLALMFGGLPNVSAISPEILSTFPDDQLWAIVHRPLAWSQDVRLRDLTELGKEGKLSADEQAEMERLIDQVDQYVLLRSQALLLLKQRGYDVEQRLRSGS